MTGAARLSGRLSMDNGDKARVTYRISSFAVDPPPPPVPPPPPNEPPPPPPPGPSGNADLIVTHLTIGDFTVKNQGTAAAGPFYVRVYNGAAVRDTVLRPGLAAGASTTMPYTERQLRGQLDRCGGLHQRGSGVQREQQHESQSRRDTDLLIGASAPGAGYDPPVDRRLFALPPLLALIALALVGSGAQADREQKPHVRLGLRRPRPRRRPLVCSQPQRVTTGATPSPTAATRCARRPASRRRTPRATARPPHRLAPPRRSACRPPRSAATSSTDATATSWRPTR